MTAQPKKPEAWLRGPIPDVPAALQPVAYALVQALEDVERATAGVEPSALWMSLGGAATIGFHLRHMANALDRLLTYARDEPLSERQFDALRVEKQPAPEVGVEELLQTLRRGTEDALAQLRSTRDEELDEFRGVGRAALPSSVRGLLYHAGEHAARHAGQVVTTAKILRGLRAG